MLFGRGESRRRHGLMSQAPLEVDPEEDQEATGDL
jgi:hypothetical protein